MPGKKLILLSLVVLFFSSGALLRDKETSSAESEANRYMWDQLHRGNYDSIDQIITKLRSEWNQSPEDPDLNKHLGFIYFWKFGERGRKAHDTSIFSNVFKSNYFFKKAIEADPSDERIYSLQSAAEMCEGTIRNDNPQVIKAYLNGIRTLKKWPQFNRFAPAAVVSVLDKNSLMFDQGLRFQWITIDECSCKKISKKDLLEHPEIIVPDLIEEARKSSDQKIKRACWNTWKAPHNFEGYMLNFGDMLVKKGNLEEAKRLYSAIKLSPSYKDWPYQSVLEERIRNIETNEKEFNKPLQLIVHPGSTQIYINSKIACVGCHQMSKNELETMKRENFSQ